MNDFPDPAEYFERREAQREADRKLIPTEILEQSIINLITNSEQFNLRLPVDRLQMIFTATRALKVIQTIESLPASEREPACRRLFSQAFNAHTNVLTMPVALLIGSTNKPAWQNGTSTGMSVCIAMFTTADLGLRSLLAEEFELLDTVPRFADTRIRLNLLRLAASRDPKSDARLSAQIGDEVKTSAAQTGTGQMLMTNWVAHFASITGQIPPALTNSSLDPYNYVKEYEFLRWREPAREYVDARARVQGTAQEELILKLRKIVFAP